MKHARADYSRIQDPAGRIPTDEPVFLLRAQDQFAAETIRFWASRVATYGGDPAIVEMAIKHAEEMDAWPTQKTPDLPSDYDESEAPAARPKLRPVGIYDASKQEGTCTLALFHCWSQDHEEFENGPGNYPVAIVELADGWIVAAYAPLVRFLDVEKEDE